MAGIIKQQPFELGKGQEHIEGQPAHRGCQRARNPPRSRPRRCAISSSTDVLVEVRPLRRFFCIASGRLFGPVLFQNQLRRVGSIASTKMPFIQFPLHAA